MNQRGFVMIGYLILLPLLLTVLAVCTSAFLLFRNDSAARHQCRVHVLRTQDQVASALTRLIEMNREAFQLRVRREEAELEVLETTGTPLMAVASAKLTAVISQQVAFAARQRALILRAQGLSRNGALSMQLRVQPTTERTRPATGGPLDFTARRHGGEFAMLASPPTSLTPDYRPAPDFSRRQEIRLQWSFSLARFLPDWLKSYVSVTGLKASANCAATVEKENGQWRAKLTADK